MKKLYQYPVNESCKVVVTLNLFTLLATLGAALPATAATTNAADNHAARPNIICILCDDLGYADVGFNAEHFGVQTDVKTPQIDAMARDGVIFPQAYVAHPFCGPSRMALFTGRMPHCFGGQKNLPDEAKNLRDYNSRGVPESEVLLSTVLQQAGYRTACIGKWHMGTAEPFRPNTRGFDEFFGFLGGGHQYFPSVTDKVKPKVNDYQYFLKRNHADYKSPEGAYLTDMLSEEAAGFIKNVAAADQPFFLYLAYNAPHSPLQGKTEDLQQLYPQHKPTNPQNGINYRDYEARQNYVAMVYAVDRGVGLLSTTLADPNGDGNTADSLTENTLVVFLSDNGGKILQAANNAPLLDDKGSTHEGGIRVPMFMHWPSQLKEETVFNHPVLALDLYPTLAALGKANLPSGKQLDGKDIWGDIKTDKNPHPNEPLFWLRHHGAGNEVAIRHDNLKAYRKNFGRWQVFDVVGDASETTDLVDSQATFLETRVAEGAAWSKTLKSPGWHDTEAALRAWQTNDLPKYDETFRLR